MDAADRYSSNSLRRFISVLNSIRFRDEMGQVEYLGQKVVLLRSDAFILMRKELSKVAGKASNVIMEVGGRRVGAEEGRVLLAKAESLGLQAADSRGEFIRIALEETNMGYGKMRLDSLDGTAGMVRVSINNCFETESGPGVNSPSCFFTLGYLKGLLSQLLGKNFNGREVSCSGRGDLTCVFELSPSQ